MIGWTRFSFASLEKEAEPLDSDFRHFQSMMDDGSVFGMRWLSRYRLAPEQEPRQRQRSGLLGLGGGAGLVEKLGKRWV